MGSRGAGAPPGDLYGGVDGTLFSSASAAAREGTESSARGAAFEVPPSQATPRFYKLEFPTYDDTVDPLNWLNQCEQFFRGQRTLASDRTWLASYHLTIAAQTWYFAIEQDEGMPHWDRFKELCHLQFGPAVRVSRLTELGRLQFTSTVQDYADRFNAVLCHARNLDAVQKAELFVGGLPDHIRVDVELRVGVLDRQTYQGGTRGSRLCGEDRDREIENLKVCTRTRDTRFIQVRAAKVASPTSCLGDQVWRPALGVGLRSGARLGTRPSFI
jgi:hypothetical protein